MRILAWGELSAEEAAQIEEVKCRYADEWSASAAPALVFFIASLPESLRGRILVELIKLDLHLCWRSARPAILERYLDQWPELKEDATIEELLEAECTARATYSQTPRRAELEIRFPDHHLSVDLNGVESFAAEQRERESFDRDGRFFVIRKLGAGGMGVVYEVLDRERQTRVALKTLNSQSPESLYRLKREFRVLSDMVDEHLVALHELIADGDHWFITMDLIDGLDLVHALSPLPSAAISDTSFETNTLLPRPPALHDPTLSHASMPAGMGNTELEIAVREPIEWTETSLREVRGAFRQLAQAVATLHAHRILHRDLKPSNVLYTSERRVVVLDFGLAAEIREVEVQAAAASQDELFVDATYVAGTANYMAPEQAAGDKLTQASDWYAVGVMLYQVLVGCRPFYGRASEVMEAKQREDPPAPLALNRWVPEDLSQLCMDLLHRDPARRPQAAEVIQRLGAEGPCSAELPRESLRDEYFIGRQGELASLERAFREAAGGATVVAVLHGPSGAGKSTLIERFVRLQGDQPDLLVLQGRCFEQESVPFKAIDSLIDDLARWLVRLDDEQREALLPDEFEYLARLFPVLRRVEFAPRRRDLPADVPDARELRRMAVRAWCEILTRIAQSHALLLAIDDLQWGDVDSALLLNELLGSSPPRMLLIACFRSEYLATSGCLKSLTFLDERWDGQRRLDVPVGPLTEREIQQLARQLLGRTAPRRDERAMVIAREADGNPYFAFELAKFLGQQGQDRSADDWGRGFKLEEVLWSRIERLPPAARELLEVVAVAGQPIPLGHAQQASGVTDELQSAWAMLRAQHLIKGYGPRLDNHLEAYHDRIRETVIGHLNPGTLKSHHRRLALSLAADEESDPETVAAHYEGAGEYVKAGEYFARAAAVAADSLAFSRAVELYQRSLDLRPLEGEVGRQLRIRLGDALANAGHGYRAGQIYRDVAAASHADAAELERAAATQFCISGHIDEGRELFRHVLNRHGIRLFTRPWQAALSLAFWRTRLALRGLDSPNGEAVDPHRAEQIDTLWSVTMGLSVVDVLGIAALQTRGLILSLEAGEPYRVSRALALESVMVALGGTTSAARAEQLQARAEQLAVELDHPHALGLSRFAAGMIRFFQVRFPEAIEQFERADEILGQRCTGVWWERSTVRTMLAWSLFHMGEANRLTSYHEQYLADAETRNDLYTVTNLRAVISPFLSLVADDPGTAGEQLGDAIRQWPFRGYHTQHMSVLFSRTHLHLYLGEPEAAWERLTREWGSLRRSLQLRNQLLRLMFLETRARAALALAAGSSSRNLLQRAERDARRLRRENTPLAEALANRTLASLAMIRGDRDACIERLQATVNGFDTLHMKIHAATARRCLGQLVGGDGGGSLVDHATETLRRENVRNISRWTRMLIAGFET